MTLRRAGKNLPRSPIVTWIDAWAGRTWAEVSRRDALCVRGERCAGGLVSDLGAGRDGAARAGVTGDGVVGMLPHHLERRPVAGP